MFKMALFNLVCLVIVGFSQSAFSADNCAPIRQATADVIIERLYWEQVGGNYELKSEVICKTKPSIGVLPGVAAGCLYPVLAKCTAKMDGSNHTLTVSGMIYHNEIGNSPTKHFSAGYHLDRNKGDVTTGEAASAEISTKDLSLKNITMSVRSKLDGPAPGATGRAFRDGLVVNVEYRDENAP